MTEQKVQVYKNYTPIINIKESIERWFEEGYIVRAFLERGSEVLVVYEREVEEE